MKPTVIATIVLTLFLGQSCNEKFIDVAQLPAPAQVFIKTHFAGNSVSIVQKDCKLFYSEYDVIFSNGDRIEFDRKGNWDEVESVLSAVPQTIIPPVIAEWVATKYPNVQVRKINQDRNDYELELTNGLELKFDKQFRLIKVDD